MRVLVYDRTQNALTKAWSAGSVLYRGLRRIDVSKGVASWDEAFAFLREVGGPIEELQYWGHGKWGEARADAPCAVHARFPPGSPSATARHSH